MSRRSDGIISLTFSDIGRSDQGQLLINRVYVRDNDLVIIKPKYKLIGRESYGVISLTFGDLETTHQGHLLRITVYVRDSAIVAMEH